MASAWVQSIKLKESTFILHFWSRQFGKTRGHYINSPHPLPPFLSNCTESNNLNEFGHVLVSRGLTWIVPREALNSMVLEGEELVGARVPRRKKGTTVSFQLLYILRDRGGYPLPPPPPYRKATIFGPNNSGQHLRVNGVRANGNTNTQLGLQRSRLAVDEFRSNSTHYQ
jgi:hypothetical protein